MNLKQLKKDIDSLQDDIDGIKERIKNLSEDIEKEKEIPFVVGGVYLQQEHNQYCILSKAGNEKYDLFVLEPMESNRYFGRCYESDLMGKMINSDFIYLGKFQDIYERR